MKIQIFGAGSIGNHLSNAARQLNHDVQVVDINEEALIRMKEQIYPLRYGEWDRQIDQVTYEQAIISKEYFDYIFIGTPPSSHIELASLALIKQPKALLIEKPLSTPLTDLEVFFDLVAKSKTRVYVGYDHSIAPSVNKMLDLAENEIGEILSIDVNFRESWTGILNAHPWLSGPEESYLGNISQGGGALCEHSHALHLWKTISNHLNLGKISVTNVDMKIEQNLKLNYDSMSHIHLKTDKNIFGRVVQDVVGIPVQKNALIQGSKGYIEWHCSVPEKGDVIKLNLDKEEPKQFLFSKNRPDDFINEILHIEKDVSDNLAETKSRISYEEGYKTMNLINQCFLLQKNETN